MASSDDYCIEMHAYIKPLPSYLPPASLKGYIDRSSAPSHNLIIACIKQSRDTLDFMDFEQDPYNDSLSRTPPQEGEEYHQLTEKVAYNIYVEEDQKHLRDEAKPEYDRRHLLHAGFFNGRLFLAYVGQVLRIWQMNRTFGGPELCSMIKWVLMLNTALEIKYTSILICRNSKS